MLFFRQRVRNLLDTEPIDRPEDRTWHVILTIASIIMGAYAGLIVSDWTNIPVSRHTQLTQAVGASARVVPNQYNSIAAQLAQKEQEIALKEAELAERERRIEWKMPLIYTTVFGVILLLLIILNFYLDYTRRTREREDPDAVRVRRAFSRPG